MADLSVYEWLGADQADVDINWEGEVYRQGCAYARELAERRLLKSRGRRSDGYGWYRRASTV